MKRNEMELEGIDLSEFREKISVAPQGKVEELARNLDELTKLYHESVTTARALIRAHERTIQKLQAMRSEILYSHSI